MRIELVPPVSEHLPIIFSWRSEATSVRHNPLSPTPYPAVVKSFESLGSDLSDLRRFERFGWTCLVNGEVAGNINLKGISQMMAYGEIGYTVGEKFQGRGVGTAMVRALLEKVFAETELRKIFALVHDQNMASRRLLARLGFREEGLLREHYIINGKPENEVFLGLLRSDWRG
jgi:ribosomal-protein-alanine N-acetyltransferase